MQVEWNNPRDPTKGFKYLFLSDADYTSIAARADTAVLKAEPFFAENGAAQSVFDHETPFLASFPSRSCSMARLAASGVHGIARRLWILIVVEKSAHEKPVHSIMKSSPVCVEVPPHSLAYGNAGERRWKITDVVGAEDGLGVECLSGSGAIASVYARAFREGFTLTLVSGRTVGIGAYLARLGRRWVDQAPL